MKKLIALLLALVMVVSMAACGSKKEDAPVEEPEVVEPAPEAVEPEAEEPAPEAVEPEAEEVLPEDGEIVEEPEIIAPEMPEVSAEAQALLDTLAQLTDGIDAGLTEMQVEIGSDLFESYTFVPYAEGYLAVTAEPMIGSIPHSVVLVQVPEGEDAAAFAASMEENMDPRKWICVEAEEAFVKTSGQYVLLVMSEQATADIIAANWDTVFGA